MENHSASDLPETINMVLPPPIGVPLLLLSTAEGLEPEPVWEQINIIAEKIIQQMEEKDDRR